MNKETFIISSAGFKIISFFLAIFVVFTVFDFDVLQFISFIFLALVIYSFRNPERESSTYDVNSITSMVDGEVIAIDEVESYADNNTAFYKVVIKSSPLDVGVLRFPFDAKIKNFKKVNGLFLRYNSSLRDDLNEYMTLEISDDNNSIFVEHKVSCSLVPISYDELSFSGSKQGTRYGYMSSGTTTMYIPKNSRLSLNIGENVKAYETLIAYVN